MNPSPSLPFDQVADRYDETRGGEPRGRQLADAVAPWLRPGRTLEIGVGTGLVAGALREQGYDVLGIDLAPAMLTAAVRRLGPRVMLGDALRLPVADQRVDNVLLVAALHAIGDVPGAIREAGRVLRPGGRLVAVFAPTARREAGTDVATAVDGLPSGDRPDTPEAVATASRDAGLTTVAAHPVIVGQITETPRELADTISQRLWSNLWRVDDADWRRLVVPVLDRLRALPDQDRPRPRPLTFQLAVFHRPPGGATRGADS